MKKSAILLTTITCALLVGCASVPMTSPTLDSQAKAFTPEPGKASIYVLRGSGGGFGSGVLFHTALDGLIAGSLAASTYQFLSVSPGEHTLTVRSPENVQQEKITAEAGRNYFYRVGVHMGWVSARAHLVALSEEEGRKAVSSSKRAEATVYK